MAGHTRFAKALRFIVPMGLVAIVAMAAAQQPDGEDNNADAARDADSNAMPQQSEVERGEYLVHHVAMCIMCHSPKTPSGQLVEQRLLQGSPIPVEAPYRGMEWALSAPDIAGLPGGWNTDDMATFLQTGETPYDHDVLPPMPPFRMQEADARAVAAYLKSLGSH